MIDHRFDQVDRRFNKLDQKVDFLTQKISDHDKQLDAIAHTVVDHTTRLDRIEGNMVTKHDHQEVMQALDKLIGIVEKKDQETTFLGVRVDRVEKDVQEIKTLVGLA